MVSSKRLYDLFSHASIIAAIALAVAVYFIIPPVEDVWIGALSFGVLAFLSELSSVSIRKHVETTITAPIIWITMILFGPFPAMMAIAFAISAAYMVGWLCAYTLSHLQSVQVHDKLRKMLSALSGSWEGRTHYPFAWVIRCILPNTAREVLNIGLASIAYRAVGGNIDGIDFLKSASALDILLHLVVPFFIAVLVYFLADEANFVTTRILAESPPEETKDWYNFFLGWRISFLEMLRLTWHQYILLPPITLLMVYLYAYIGLWSGLCVLWPFLSFRSSVQKAVEQEEMYMETIATLGTYMQHYHPYTRGHLKRVADLSERLARELRLSADVIMLMPYAGLLHDIGKVGVSELILDKVGKLTDEEWAAIKEHPVKGAEIVSHLEFLNKTVDWIRYHHKWANGSGYPDDGVKNGEVPIEAAIIAVADAFDAMTDDRELSLDWVCDSCGYKPEDDSRPTECPVCGAAKRRSYREPLSFEQAIDELRRGAGSQFSPIVVKAFLAMSDREGIGFAGNK